MTLRRIHFIIYFCRHASYDSRFVTKICQFAFLNSDGSEKTELNLTRNLVFTNGTLRQQAENHYRAVMGGNAPFLLLSTTKAEPKPHSYHPTVGHVETVLQRFTELTNLENDHIKRLTKVVFLCAFLPALYYESRTIDRLSRRDLLLPNLFSLMQAANPRFYSIGDCFKILEGLVLLREQKGRNLPTITQHMERTLNERALCMSRPQIVIPVIDALIRLDVDVRILVETLMNQLAVSVPMTFHGRQRLLMLFYMTHIYACPKETIEQLSRPFYRQLYSLSLNEAAIYCYALIAFTNDTILNDRNAEYLDECLRSKGWSAPKMSKFAFDVISMCLQRHSSSGSISSTVCEES